MKFDKSLKKWYNSSTNMGVLVRMKEFSLKSAKDFESRLKINRKGLSLTAALLIGATLLSGCGKTTTKYSGYNNPVITNTNYYNTTTDDTSDTKKTYLTEDELMEISEQIGRMVNISDVNTSAFLEYVSKVDNSYHYEDLFEIDEALNKYYSTPKAKATSHATSIIGANNEFDYDTVYAQIKKNNQRYQEENNPKNGKVNFYKELDEEQLKRTCTLITEVLNSYLKSHMVSDIGELSCIVGNLKVLRDNTSFSNAYVTDDDCMLISPSMLNVMDIMTKEKTFDQVVTHEIEHLLQKRCQDNLKSDVRNVGICYSYDDLEINPLYFSWFFEASAEKETCNYKYDAPITYKNMIGYLESLNISTMLYSDVSALQSEKLCTSRDLDSLFSQFHCETLEDKKEVIKMMFAIDIIQNENEEFLLKYSSSTGVKPLSEDILNMKYELKPDICTTYLKSFYRSLTAALSTQSIPLKDVFYLIRLTEADVNNHILYNDDEYSSFNKDFLQKASAMQEEFFGNLNCGYSTAELNDLYKNYQLATKTSEGITYNCDFGWLSQDKKEYLMKRTDFLLEYSGKGIQEATTKQIQKQK